MVSFSKNFKLFFVTLLIILNITYTNSFAQNTNYGIKIIGNERIDDQTILSNLDVAYLRKGSLAAINKSLKKLYDLDLFSDVDIYQSEGFVIIKVTENPIIKDVIFQGNKKVDEDTLLAEIKLKKRAIYTKSKLESDIKRINDIYVKSGRFLTKIDPQIQKEDQNRINLIFKISEGKKAKIKNIYLVGNNVFSDQDLLDEVTTKKSKWFKPFSSSDSYDSDRMDFDKEKLRRFYNSKGYADFSVISANAQITPLKDKFYITFLLEEGIKYNFGEITIDNKVKKFDESLLKKSILTKKSKVYNADLVNNTIDKFTTILSENGYAFTNIEPVLKRNKEKKIIDIEYVIRETPRIYINEISITGNDRTLDKVIRRELRVREGDPFNITKINRSKQRIENLGFFEKVDFKTNRIGNSDKVNIAIEVKEKKTGELNFGIGYSTVDKMTGNIGIAERNLFGTGQEISVNTQKSSTRLSNEISYTKPYFMGRELAAGVDVFNYQLDKRDSLVYDQNSKGLTLRAGYAISEYIDHTIRYSYRDEEISNIEPTASPIIQSLKGKYVNSSIGQSLSLDKRDNKFDPKDGYYIGISQNYAGVGGDVEYLKHEGNASYYIPIINDNFVLKFSGRFGYIDGIGQDIKSNDNFFLGGNNFRGFEYAGIGPRAVVNGTGSAIGGNAVGGKLYYVSTTEFRFPLGLPKELGINAALFHDIGTLKLVDNFNKQNTQIIDDGSLRSSYGLSLVWASPLGPIRLDFSKVNQSEVYDRTESFRFSFGTNF